VKGKRSAACPEPALGYRHAKRKAELAGTYTLTLVPDPAARVELEHGAVLTERVTLVLRSGPTERVRRTLLVRVSLAASHRTGSHG